MQNASAARHDSSHGTPRRAAAIWSILILATGLTWMVGERGDTGPIVAGLLFTIAFGKGALIILDYMALRRAPLLWPLLTLGWMLVVCAMIGLAYLKGIPT